MVTLFAVLRRRPDLDHDQFVAHWRDTHGPLIAGLPELARHLLRYEQHVRHRPDALSGTDGVDGVAVQRFASLAALEAFVSEPAYGELIAPDERRFLDVEHLEFVVCDEPTVVIGGDAPQGGPRGDG